MLGIRSECDASIEIYGEKLSEKDKSRFKKGAHIRDSIERVETSEWQPADKGILLLFHMVLLPLQAIRMDREFGRKPRCNLLSAGVSL